MRRRDLNQFVRVPPGRDGKHHEARLVSAARAAECGSVRFAVTVSIVRKLLRSRWLPWAVGGGVVVAVALLILAAFERNDFMRVTLPGYLTGIGTLALAGTTVWLRHSEVEEHRLDRSHAAAFALARALGPVARRLGQVTPTYELHIEDWLFDVATYGGDLVDTEVLRRVNEVSDELAEFDKWNFVNRPWKEADARKRELKPRLSWLGQTLSAHRAGQPLPPEPAAEAEKDS